MMCMVTVEKFIVVMSYSSIDIMIIIDLVVNVIIIMHVYYDGYD